MNKFIKCLINMNEISQNILKCIVVVWMVYIFSYAELRIAYINSNKINLVLAVCVQEYPFLIFMTLCLGIVGSLLIDIYRKTQKSDQE